MDAQTNKLQVSDLFVDIFKHFNVVFQNEKMKTLSRRELLLLLIIAVDSYSEDDQVVIENFRNYKDELTLIYDLQNDETVTDEDLLYLADKTDEKYIDTSNLITSDGNKLPSPTTQEAARIIRRDLGISQIFDEQ